MWERVLIALLSNLATYVFKYLMADWEKKQKNERRKEQKKKEILKQVKKVKDAKTKDDLRRAIGDFKF